MKLLLASLVLLSFGAFTAEIENGKFQVEVNVRILSQEGSCDTFTDGNFTGITNSKSDLLSYAYEIDTTKATGISREPYSIRQNIGTISAKGFCSIQNLLTSLEVTYTKSADKVSFTYKYRCNRRVMTRTVSCISL